MPKNKIVIYSALVGSRGSITEPSYIPKGVDFIFFTDQKQITSKVWQVRRVEPIIPGDTVRSARAIKALAHKFLPEYEYSIWVDANLEIRGDIVELLKEYIMKPHNQIAAFSHANNRDSRNSVAEELEALLEANRRGRFRDQSELMKKQFNRYKEAGFPDTNGLVVSMVLLRKHNDPLCRQTMEEWWNEIKNFSRRDQLSFNYVCWKNNLPITYLPGDSRNNPYIKFHPHVKTSSVKRLKSRLKKIMSSLRNRLNIGDNYRKYDMYGDLH